MGCAEAVIALFLLTPCEEGGGALDVAIAESLAAPERIEADRQRDPLRRPDQVLEFFEIRPGMTVLDLFSGSGYYTEIVSRVVGDDGKVVAHNNQAYIDYEKDQLDIRYANGRLGNVERITAEADDLDLPASTFDAALAILTWHDFYYEDPKNHWPAVDRALLVQNLCRALKPGAVLGIADHVTTEGSDPAVSGKDLHRVDPKLILDDLEGSCFEYEGELNVLRNPNDPLDKPMYAEAIRGRTDRVVYKYRRR